MHSKFLFHCDGTSVNFKRKEERKTKNGKTTTQQLCTMTSIRQEQRKLKLFVASRILMSLCPTSKDASSSYTHRMFWKRCAGAWSKFFAFSAAFDQLSTHTCCLNLIRDKGSKLKSCIPWPSNGMKFRSQDNIPNFNWLFVLFVLHACLEQNISYKLFK